MLRHWKRIAALVLTACLLLSVIPAAPAAATVVKTYNLNLVERGLVNSGLSVTKAQTVINDKYAKDGWKWEASSITTETALRFYKAGLTAWGGVSDWMAIRIKAPATGTYTLGLEYGAHPYNGTVAVYVLPGDTQDVASALNRSNRVGELSLWKEDQAGNADYIENFTIGEGYVGTCSLTASQEYIVVFEGCEASPYHTTRAYMSISKLTLTQGTVSNVPQTPTASSVQVNPGPVTLLEGCYYGTTMEINGHDYLFEPVEGNKMLAFDMDSFTRKYAVDVPYLVTRGITTDANDDLWLCGDNKFLYRFDPRTRIGEKTKAFDTVDPGATSGFDMVYADGCVYFGTNPTGSLIKYDIAEDTFTRLYTNGGSYANGLVYKDGYLYAGIYDVRDSSNQSWKVVKVNVNDTTDVTTLDIVGKMPSGSMFYDAALAGDLLLFGGGNSQTQMIAVDPDTMTLEELNINGGICYSISEEVDGKVYFVMNHATKGMGLYAFDVQNKTADRLMTTQRPLHCVGRSIIQVDDVNYPGNNIAVYATINGEPMLYNLEKKIVKRGLELVKDYGTATHIRSIINGAEGSGDLYIGAFNVASCAIYNTNTEMVGKFATLGQTDSLCYYDGKLYAGNYPNGAIVRVNLEDASKNETLLTLNDDTYDQARIHTLTAGDGKIFAGTTPDKGAYGGCLAWVDVQSGETYVEKNVVQDQTVNCVVYHDGLIYGTTSVHGGTGATKPANLSAKLFIYDVNNKQKLGEFDLREYLTGYTRNIDYISGIAADPNVPGRFWGLVSETLFSFTYDRETNALTVAERLNYNKNSYPTGNSRGWFPKPFCFDDNGNLYLSFGEKGGMRRINTQNTADNTRLVMPEPLYYALGEDGNLYYSISEALYAYPLNTTQENADAAAVVDQLIAGIGSPITLEDAAAIRAARAAYSALKLGEKAWVQNLSALEEKEAQLLDLQIAQLPEIPLTDYKAQVLALYETYEAMTSKQQGIVNNASQLYVAYEACSDKCYAANGTLFATWEAAAAAGGEYITLIDNAEETELLLTDGITLDLNGFILTTEAFRAYLGDDLSGFVVDSSDGNNGLLKTVRGEDLFRSDNPDMPLYDAIAGGYRFFDYKLALHSGPEKVNADKQKFWFKFHFYTDDTGAAELDQDAYGLLAAGETGFAISARLTWRGTQLPQVYFGRNGSTDTFNAAWADGITASRWLYMVVSGLEDITSGTLTVEPVLMDNGVEVTGGVITYERKLESTGGWSDEGPDA